MSIKYYKLLDMLNRKGISKEKLRQSIGTSSATMAKISANEYVSLSVIDDICYALNCQPGDIMEHVKVEFTTSHKPDAGMTVSHLLQQLGMPHHMAGFRYMRDAILLAMDDPNVMFSVTKSLYPQIAEKHSTTPVRVERAIRHSIEVVLDRGDIEVLNTFFNFSHSRRISNSEFISVLSESTKAKILNRLDSQ